MPEEKKKDSFTFSDKIKNSKPAASKSFANRISSKIGSDGKPKKTLFERTKRDAPFFIAAIVALLLLPFLYKYSGTVSEEPLVTPGSEESMFDPERYGFDTVAGDPEGQIAQLAGRDPLSLIKGFGSGEEASDDSHLYDIDRSGLDDSQSYTGTSVEEHNTNVYKQNAAPATRAAFRRAATKIGSLPSAGLNSRGGGKLGVGMWGGGLKTAAKRVGAEAPRTSPKPVSLQPLQAAGKPSRSYFGQGAAAEARRSRDAMSKGNAMQALMDAQMKPIEPGKIGGLTGGAFGPGGGNGDLKRSFAFNGKEPWWWDMMKKRSQMEWEADFNRKWDWIKWKDKLLQGFLDGVFSCLLTGTDDWSMGKMFGAAAGAGNEDECAGLTKAKWEKAYPTVPFEKKTCRSYFKYKIDKDVQDPWKGGNANEISMGPITQRIDCLSNGLGGVFSGWFGKNKGTFAETGDCNTFGMNGIYHANFASSKDGWVVLHYVVGVKTTDLAAYYNKPPDEQKKDLVIGYIGNGPEFNANIDAAKLRTGFVPLFIESVAIKGKKIDKKKSATATNTGYKYAGYFNNGVKGGGFEAKTYEDAIAKCKSMKWPTRQDCLNDINSQAKNVDKVKRITAVVNDTDFPRYVEFFDVLRDGGAIRDSVTVGPKENLALSTKKAKEGKDWVTGAYCPYPLVRVSCDYFANATPKGSTAQGWPYAHLKFANGMNTSGGYERMKNRFFISYNLQGQDNSQPAAATTETKIATGQWFPVPHMNVRPFKGAWSQEMTNSGFVSTNLGTERSDLPGSGDNYQVVATSNQIPVLRKEGQRIIITWEIRQCDSVTTDGSSITQGGCNNGNIVIKDDKGNATGTLGQDRPGRVVSSVTCIYEDGSDPTGFGTVVGDDNPEDDVVNPDPQTRSAPPANGGVQLELANIMNGSKGISDRFATERQALLKLPALNVYGKSGAMPFGDALAKNTCTDVGVARGTKKGAARMFNQAAAKAYVNSVIAETNASQDFTAAQTEFVHQGDVSVPQLVDAMTIAYTRNANAQVPLDVVCALGKTIGYHSYDPQMMKVRAPWRNTFGAFAAYTGPDSSHFPSALTIDQNNNIIADRRFLGCGLAKDTSGKVLGAAPKDGSVRPYHYGRYNWNARQIGDNAQLKFAGQTGRDGYLGQLKAGGWAQNPNDPNSFPLHAIADKVGFQQRQSATDAELKHISTNATIDDINRQEYVRMYQGIFNDRDTSCGLDGNMPVEEALQYIGALCINGKNAKPSNGNTDACYTRYKASRAPGTAGGEIQDEE